jgi:threonine synthase
MIMPKPTSFSLVCPECGKIFDPETLQTFCSACNSPILVKYDLHSIKSSLTPAIIAARPRGLWRWSELLPVLDPTYQLTLGEGDTPLLEVNRLGHSAGLNHLYLKDESLNATGSFKARGLAVAVSKALELGVKHFVIPTAGNAGGALAAYAARAGVPAAVFMPQETPLANQREVEMSGASMHLVAGSISDAGKAAAAFARESGAFDMSTFKEPYRVEGKKTLGFELAETFGWQLPDVIVYPTGGGTGLVGMWKAFQELEVLGWIDSHRPRMVVVQAAGCAPIVRAFEQNSTRSTPWENPVTQASGLRVPNPFADRLILRTLRDSQGIAVSVSEEQIWAAQNEVAAQEGVFCAPEGSATWAGSRMLAQSGWIHSDEKVVLFNTGSGLKNI